MARLHAYQDASANSNDAESQTKERTNQAQNEIYFSGKILCTFSAGSVCSVTNELTGNTHGSVIFFFF